MRRTVVSPAPERHREVGRQVVVDAEALGVFDDQRHADVARQTHRHLVDRMFDAEAQRMRAAGLALEILRPPDFAVALIDLDRLVEDDRRGRIAVVERGRIDERLERRAGLALRLRRAVEFRLVVGEAADHRKHAAGERVHRHAGARHFRNLAQAIFAGACRRSARHRRHRPVLTSVFGLAIPVHFMPSSVDGAGLASATDARRDLSRSGCRPMRPRRRWHRATTASRQGRRRRSSGMSASATPQSWPRSIDLHRPAPAMRLVVAHEPVDQRLARHQLHLRIERRANREPALVELLLAVAFGEFAPHFLGEKAGGDRIRRQHARGDVQRLGRAAFACSAVI